MKKNLLFAAALIFCATMLAQAPQGITHQAVMRNAANDIVANQEIGIKVSILQGTAQGTAVYVETHQPETNQNGLTTFVIGQGAPASGSFDEIDWGEGPYFLKTEADPEGGTNYSITGTMQFLSVPYALQAKTAENVPTGTAPGEMQYWDGIAWVNVPPGNSGQVLTFLNGVPIWITIGAVIGGSTDVYNPATGKLWMDRNLGATQVATSSTDVNSYGYLYQWGRGTDGHQVRTSGTTTTLSNSNSPGHVNFILASSEPYDWRSPQNDNLWQGVSGVNNPCPSGYRLPTDAEWNAERLSWNANNADGAFASPLKLPLAGRRLHDSGSLGNLDSRGYYWSGTVDGIGSRSLFFLYSGPASIFSYNRASGNSVRCIKD